MHNYWSSCAVFVGVYLTSVAAIIWTMTSVLCLGDPKFDNGCGGFSLYYTIWALAYSPLVALALVLVRPSKLSHAPKRRNALLAAYLGLIIVAIGGSLALDVELMILAIALVVLGFTFALLRWWVQTKGQTVDRH